LIRKYPRRHHTTPCTCQWLPPLLCSSSTVMWEPPTVYFTLTLLRSCVGITGSSKPKWIRFPAAILPPASRTYRWVGHCQARQFSTGCCAAKLSSRMNLLYPSPRDGLKKKKQKRGAVRCSAVPCILTPRTRVVYFECKAENVCGQQPFLPQYCHVYATKFQPHLTQPSMPPAPSL